MIITVPGLSVVLCDKKLISFGTPKIRSSVPLACFSTPFLTPRIVSFDGSGSKAGETSVGPKGSEPSKLLEKHHWLCANWLVRLDMSLEAV